MKPGLYLDGAVELLFYGKDWEVWTPKTFEGSKALRRGAAWCTGGDTCVKYDDYNNKGTLYVIIKKDDQSEKYQLFVSDDNNDKEREFRDKDNTSQQFRKFVHENPELLEFFLTQDDVRNNYKNLDDPDFDDEWTEEKERDIMEEYNLSYDDNGDIIMNIIYDDLV